MSKEEVLVRKVGAARGVLTKSLNKLKECSEGISPDLQKIEVLKGTIKAQANRLESLNGELEGEMGVEDLEKLENFFEKAEEYRNEAQLGLSFCDSVLKEERLKCKEEVKSGSETLKLPKLTLPSFNGEILEWLEFHELFSVTIDKQKIANVEKLQYLKGCLKGEAARLILGLSLTNDNYATAMDLLQSRYGCKRRIIRTHIQALLSMKSPNIKAYISLREFVDGVNKHIRGLKTLGVSSDNYDLILYEILLSKLPSELKHECAKLSEEGMTLNQLLNIVETEAKHLDILNSTMQDRQKQTSTPVPPKMLNRSLNLFIKGQACNFCQSEDHRAYQCPVFLKKTAKERVEMVKGAKLCFNCLKSHLSRNCTSKHRCKECNKSHNTLLHFNEEKVQEDNIPAVQSKCFVSRQASKSILPTFFLPVQTGNGIQYIGTLIDSGSERSFISKSVQAKFSFPIVRKEKLNIEAFSGPIISETCDVVELNVQIDQNSSPVQLLVSQNMREIKNNSIDLSRYSNIRLPLCDRPCDINIILGADYFYSFVSGNVISIDEKLKFLETKLGYVAHGSLSVAKINGDSCHSFFSQCVDVDNNLDVKAFWDNEIAGIEPASSYTEHSKLLKEFDDHIKFSNGRYSVNLPWLPKRSITSDFLVHAKRRLSQTTRKLINARQMLNYHNVFKEYLDSGIIERCSMDDKRPMRYIPHHPVIRNDAKTTKLRIVYDASSKEKNDLSVNECLFEGPNLFPSLLGVLIRFRLRQYGLTADIQKAFLQIEMDKDERDFMRFLWYETVDDENQWPDSNIVAYRFRRVPFGFKSSPFILNRIINHHLNTEESNFSTTVNYVRNNIYVDDLILSVDNESELLQIKTDIVQIMAKMSMNLHKWGSNSGAVDNTDDSKILGINWNSNSDQLFVKFPMKFNIKTKRELLSFLCGLFDPLGLFIPTTNKLKLLVQSAWHQNCDWDSEMPQNIQEELNPIYMEVEEINKFSFKRWIGFSLQCSKVELHAYSDASSQIYSTCIYFVFQCDDVQVSNLICAKSRVAPKRALTIPRLELLGNLLSARLLHSISEQMPKGLQFQTKSFTDSQIVLAWIRNQHKVYKQFVQSRVEEIRGLIPINSLFYVASKQNPADLATRSNKTSAWLHNPLWWHGPKEPSKEETDSDQTLETNEEVMRTMAVSTISPVFEFSRFSNYKRLLMTVFFVLKFCKIVQEFDRKTIELYILKQQQRQDFPSEITKLEDGDSVSKQSKIANLYPFIDQDGLLRSTGRLQNSELSLSAKHPIILNKSYFTFLLLSDIHANNFHAGVSQMCATSRERFWILQCRRACKHVVHRCTICQRFKSQPLQECFDTLPSERVTVAKMKPFQFCGVDYMGPILVLENKQKFYVILITCMQTRAIHLELVTSLNTKDFLQAFCRFVARRGLPSQVRSDNARTFHAVALKLKLSHGIEWKFNVAKAPWAGGTWERLVRSVKSSLRLSLNKVSFDIQSLESLLCHIEYVINCRPLTYSNGNEEDLTPLTPNCFLHPSGQFETSREFFPDQATLRLANVQNTKFARLFWVRWKREYLTLLNENRGKSASKPISVGDILLLNEGTKRQYWPLVRVTKLLPGRDGRLRSVQIQVRGKVLTRPLKLLHFLELGS